MRPSPALLRAALPLLLVPLAQSASAARLELEGGRSYMGSHATNAAFVEAVFNGHRIGDGNYNWAPDVSLGWIQGRDVTRYRNSAYTTHDAVWLFAAGARLYRGDPHGWFLGLQAAAQDGRTQALSSGYEFVTTLGWQGRHFSVQVRHVSNAGLHEPNLGETMALVGLGFDL